MDDTPPNEQPRRNIDDPDFWQELQSTFMTALDLLQEIAEARGIQVAAPSAETVRESEQKLDEQARTHPLAVAAEEYANLVNHWFREAKGRIRQWSREAARVAEMDVAPAALEDEVSALQEAIEEIASHRYQIHVKLARALRSQMRADSPVLAALPELDVSSAAEAYCGVEKSIEMWMRVMEFFPEEEDSVLRILIHLKELGQAIPQVFPEISDLNV